MQMKPEPNQEPEAPEIEIPRLIIFHLRDCLGRRDIEQYYKILRGIQAAWQTLKPELAEAIRQKSLEN